MRDDTAVTATTGRGARAAGLRTRFDSFRATRRRGSVGLPEFVALGVAALLLLTAVLAYLFLLVPQKSRAASLEAEGQDLQRLLASQRSNIGESRGTEQRVSDILSSLGRFEVDHLGLSGSGTKTVIEELNRLIIKDGLRISGGVQFTQLQEAAPGEDERKRRNTTEETAQRVVQSVFPGIGVTLTVEGTYPNLRRFIRDIEADRQFVVINAVELEGVTDSNAAQLTAPQAVPPAVPPAAVAPETPGAQPQVQTPSRGALVSLRLDMAAYFRRASAPAE
ncbi:MAG TPA: GspMb/PilO family protein [Pyrinomonadaceae bacterium]|nr:GspMb/PilO family protein [Pyrinomonadaceae bacterium]